VAIELTVVTREGEAYAGSVEEVVLPGSEGEFGVIALHERFLAPLRPGIMEIRTGAGSVWHAVSDGFADINGERVVVIVDSCQRPDEIAVDAARAELAEAEAALAELGAASEDDVHRAKLRNQIDRARAALAVQDKA